jgi:hypothetical protein
MMGVRFRSKVVSGVTALAFAGCPAAPDGGVAPTQA